MTPRSRECKRHVLLAPVVIVSLVLQYAVRQAGAVAVASLPVMVSVTHDTLRTFGYLFSSDCTFTVVWALEATVAKEMK